MPSNVWVIRAEGGQWTDHFVKGGYVGGGWLSHKDLSEIKTKSDLDTLYAEAEPERSANSLGAYVGQVNIFHLEMQPDDYVITPASDSRWLYYGQLLNEPYYYSPNDSDGCWFAHRRPVEWAEHPIDRSTMTVPFQYMMRASRTAFRVSHMYELFQKIGKEGRDKNGIVALDSHAVILGQILELNAKGFECLIGELLKALNFTSVEVTGKPGDGGIDVVGDLDVPNLANVKVSIQAKRYQQSIAVNAATVHALADTLASKGGQGAVITTSSFDNAAQSAARERGIGLIDGYALVDLLVENWEGISDDFREKLGLKRGLVLA